MSAIAFIITPDKTYLYSDGYGEYTNGVKIDNFKKLHKVNDGLAFLSAGRWKPGVIQYILDQIDESGLTDIHEVTDLAAGIMKEELSGISYESDCHPDGTCSTYLLVFGYHQWRPVYVLIDAKNDFEPQPVPITNTMFVGSMIYGNYEKENTFTAHLRECLATFPVDKAGYKAFEQYIDDYKHTSRVVDHIFEAVISNPHCKVQEISP